MSLKSLPFVTILLFSSVILSCLEDSCPEVLPYFEVIGLEGFTNRINSEIPLSPSNPVEWDKIEYRLGFLISGVAESKMPASGNLFALDCAPFGYLGSKVGIESLVVRPLTVYSDSETPESFSSGLFRVGVINEVISVQEFNLIFRGGYNFTSFKLFLNKPPKINGESHRFEVEIVFLNGEKSKFITPELRILK